MQLVVSVDGGGLPTPENTGQFELGFATNHFRSPRNNSVAASVGKRDEDHVFSHLDTQRNMSL